MQISSHVQISDFDIILINSSGGKDSQAMLSHIHGLAVAQGVEDRLVVVHSDLGEAEWPGTGELAELQATMKNIPFIKVSRTQDSLLEYVRRRGKWPDAKNRYCTSDFKRAPIRKVMTLLVDRWRAKHGKRQVKLLNCMGLRAQESAARAKKVAVEIDKSASNGKREVTTWLPIHDWLETQVWDEIRASGLPHHNAYDLGMPRLSCMFCIFAPKAALAIAAKANPPLFEKYLELETEIGHTFRHKFSLQEVKDLVTSGQSFEQPQSWSM